MAASQRLSRGLYRFGLFSVSIVLIVGCALSVFFAFDKAKSARRLWPGVTFSEPPP